MCFGPNNKVLKLSSHCCPFPVPNARGSLVARFDSVMTDDWL